MPDVLVVTGGSRGIGRAVATGFAALGASVVVASRKADACGAAADEIRDAGGVRLDRVIRVPENDQKTDRQPETEAPAEKPTGPRQTETLSDG